MTFDEMRKDEVSAVSDAFHDTREDEKFWQALQEGDLTEIGRRVYINFEGVRKDLETEEAEGFDTDEAASDVILQSREADIKQYGDK